MIRANDENLYLMGPTAMLDVPMPITGWEKNDIMPIEYYSINEYVASYGHTIEQFNTDGSLFVKGFNWTVDKIDEARALCEASDELTYGENVRILNHNETMELLASDAWNADVEVQ